MARSRSGDSGGDGDPSSASLSLAASLVVSLVSGPYSFSKNSLGLEGFLWTSLVRGGGEVSVVVTLLVSCLLVVMSTGRGENMTSSNNNLD